MPILFLYFEWLAFLCSILLLWKGVDKFYKWFFVFCTFVLIIEYIALWIIFGLHMKSNHILYNIAIPIFCVFLMSAIKHFLLLATNRKIANLFILLFCLFWIFDIIFLQGYTKFASYGYILGCTFIVCLCVLYFIELINKSNVIQIKSEPSFFIVSGFFFYSFLNAFVYTLHAYFAYRKESFDEYRNVFKITMDISNVVLYLLLSVAFIIIWSQRKL